MATLEHERIQTVQARSPAYVVDLIHHALREELGREALDLGRQGIGLGDRNIRSCCLLRRRDCL